ncbi:MAG: GAF domain-containing protein [Nitrospinota bacterium]|nr:GAF domain-containing protein [Nitrospinota bacterium]
MQSGSEKMSVTNLADRQCREEHDILHNVVKILHLQEDLQSKLESVLTAMTRFSELQEEFKAGIFLADEKQKVLRLFCTVGELNEKFLARESEIPYGHCLCGMAAECGQMVFSDSCGEDGRFDPKNRTRAARGAYVVPLKHRERVVGVMFLYTDEFPSVQGRNRELISSIGGLIGDAIASHQRDEELLAKDFELFELQQLNSTN